MGGTSGRGRRRTKTTAQHKRDGTYRKSRHGGPEVEFSRGSTKPPPELSPAAKREWKRVYPGLVKLGMFTVADRAVFSVYCQAFAEFFAVTQELNAMNSHTFRAGNGSLATVPQIAQRAKLWTMLRESASRFGLDPVSRIGLDVTPPPAVDPDEEFFFGGPRG